MKDKTKQHHAKDAKVLPCVCDHGYQDRKHNPSMDGYRCTVCGMRTTPRAWARIRSNLKGVKP